MYIINRGKNPNGSQRGWLKIRVLRNGEGYKLQYAPISSATYQELTIAKHAHHNFSFVSLSGSSVDVEPTKDSWDIAFTTFTNLHQIAATTKIPYGYNDFVIHNRNEVTVVQVMTAGDMTYESFDKDDVAGLDFKSAINTIGSSWRIVAQPGSGQETNVRTDRFYVLNDTDGNIYKFRFTRLLDPVSGDRGYPQLEYELVN